MAYKINDAKMIYTEGTQARVSPIYTGLVNAGDSWGADFDIHFETAKTTKRMFNPMTVGIHFWAVPFRLLDDGWVQAFSESPVAGNTGVPLTSAVWAQMFDADPRWNSNRFVAFPRRAYKMGYNQFYGDQKVGGSAWYEDFKDDTETTLGLCRNPEMFSHRMMLSADQERPQYAIPAVPHNIDLADFAQQQKRARALISRDTTGDNYVDALRRMGVAMNTEIVQSPKTLYRNQFFCAPRDETAVGPAGDLGDKITRWVTDQRCTLRPTFFAEHSAVIGVLTMRTMAPNLPSQCPAYHTLSDVGRYLGAPNDNVYDQNFIVDAGGEAARTNLYAAFYGGYSQFYQQSWLGVTNETTVNGYQFPVGSDIPFDADELGGRDFAAGILCKQQGNTRLNPSLTDRVPTA